MRDLNKLATTWQHFKVINKLDTIEADEILDIIGRAETVPFTNNRMVVFQQSLLICLLFLFCQSC